MAKLSNRPVDYQQAESYYQQCLARNPNQPTVNRGLAVLLAEQNRGPEAIAMVQRWAQISPQSPQPYIELARLNDEFGNKAAAQMRSSKRSATIRTIPARSPRSASSAKKPATRNRRCSTINARSP